MRRMGRTEDFSFWVSEGGAGSERREEGEGTVKELSLTEVQGHRAMGTGRYLAKITETFSIRDCSWNE